MFAPNGKKAQPESHSNQDTRARNMLDATNLSHKHGIFSEVDPRLLFPDMTCRTSVDTELLLPFVPYNMRACTHSKSTSQNYADKKPYATAPNPRNQDVCQRFVKDICAYAHQLLVPLHTNVRSFHGDRCPPSSTLRSDLLGLQVPPHR